MLSENGLTEAQRDKLGLVAIAEHAQECLRCHRAIERGGSVVSGAINYFTGQPVWMHPPCAELTLGRLGARLEVDDGWRQATSEQKCATCRDWIKVGQKIYRLWPPNPTANPILGYACRGCWRKSNSEWIEDL